MLKFDFFSVREESAVKICADEFDCNAQWVIDPVFLCDLNSYIELINHAYNKDEEKPYLLAYVLDSSREKEEILNMAGNKMSLSVIKVPDMRELRKSWNNDSIFINDWLKLIYNSEFFITDSFHGSCFAIIFHKPFYAIANRLRGETRFISLLNRLGLQDRLVYTYEELREKLLRADEIDWKHVDNLLEQWKTESREWLLHAIESEAKKKPMSEFDLLDSRCDDLCLRFDRKLDMLQAEINKVKSAKQKEYIFRRFARLFKGGIKCLKDNGLSYTWTHFWVKVKNKLAK